MCIVAAFFSFNTHTAAYRTSLAYQNQKAMFLTTSTLDSSNSCNENYKRDSCKGFWQATLKILYSYNSFLALELRRGIQRHFKILQTLPNGCSNVAFRQTLGYNAVSKKLAHLSLTFVHIAACISFFWSQRRQSSRRSRTGGVGQPSILGQL